MEYPTILLVEDNPDDQALARRAFKALDQSHRLAVVSDGLEALEFLRHESPAVVMLDMQMPRMGGLEVLKQIRSNTHTRWVPVVMFSSSDLVQDKLSAYRLGANSYVRKPQNYRKFERQIATLVEYWLHLNQTPNINES